MATQSKSVLIPFLIIAGLIFAVALGWKYLGDHDAAKGDAEKTTVVDDQLNEPDTLDQKPTQVVKGTQPETMNDQTEVEPFIEPVIESKEVRRKRAENKMRFAMRYGDFDKAVLGLRRLRDDGKDDEAEDLIDFIRDSYPAELIPSDLLD